VSPKIAKVGKLATQHAADHARDNPTPDPLASITQPVYGKALFIDPGNRWTGVAIFTRDDLDDTWDCTDAFTVDRLHEDKENTVSLEQFEDWLASTTSRGEWDIMGYEVYRLFNDKAEEQTGSEFEAIQLIGTYKFLARRNQYMNRWPRQAVELTRFRPERKKPTYGIMKKRGYTWESERRGNQKYGIHAKDAECQGIFELENERGFTILRKAPE